IALLSWAVLLALDTVEPQAHPWLTLGAATLASSLVTAQTIAIRRLPEREYAVVRDVASTAGTFFAAALIWQVVPHGYLGLGWFALAIVCLETGRAAAVKWLPTQPHPLRSAGIGTLAGINVLGMGGVPPHQLASLG